MWASRDVSESMCMSMRMAKRMVCVYECEWSEYYSVSLSVHE